jgi:hypothetical protein
MDVMSDNLENECTFTSSFTIEEFRKDDPRLKEFEIPEEENQPSFDAIILLIPGSDELEIEDF